MLRNILSYPVGTIFSGKEIKDWIAYNLFHPSSKTLMAKRMEKIFKYFRFSSLFPSSLYSSSCSCIG